MPRLIFLEWARGIAALFVVLHHATLDAPAFYQYEPFGNIFYFGMAGVDFFFVLSGFIIYYIHSEDSGTLQSIKRYILKRLIRVYPIFLVISTLLLLAYIVLPQFSQRVNLLDISFLTTSFLLLPSSVPPLLTVSWTLVHEMFFYLLFILVIFNKKIGLSIFILWAGVILFLNFSNQMLSFPTSFYFHFHNLEFILGIMIAFIVKNDYTFLSDRVLPQILFASLMVFIANGMNQNYEFIPISYLVTTSIYGLSAAMTIYTLVLLPQNSDKNKMTQILSLLGAASYSIYLIHLPILSILHRIVLQFHLDVYIYPNFIFIFIVSLAVVSGIFTHLFIEQPIIKSLRNRINMLR